MQANIDKLSAHEHLVLAGFFQAVCGRRSHRRRVSRARILRRRRLQCGGGSSAGVTERLTSQHCRGHGFDDQLEFHERDVVYGFGCLDWNAGDERQPHYGRFDGERELHVDLRRCGWQ